MDREIITVYNLDTDHYNELNNSNPYPLDEALP